MPPLRQAQRRPPRREGSAGPPLAGELKVVRVDVDRAPEVAQRFQRGASPGSSWSGTSGHEVERRIGAASEREFEQYGCAAAAEGEDDLQAAETTP